MAHLNTPLRPTYQTTAIRLFIGLGQGGALWFPDPAYHETLWAPIVFILCADLGFYSGFREAPLQSSRFYDAVWPTFYLPLMGLLFVGHALVAAADADRKKWTANFSIYFNVSWKQVTQLALAGIFVRIFWAVLAMDAALFGLIKIDLSRRLRARSSGSTL